MRQYDNLYSRYADQSTARSPFARIVMILTILALTLVPYNINKFENAGRHYYNQSLALVFEDPQEFITVTAVKKISSLKLSFLDSATKREKVETLTHLVTAWLYWSGLFALLIPALCFLILGLAVFLFSLKNNRKFNRKDEIQGKLREMNAKVNRLRFRLSFYNWQKSFLQIWLINFLLFSLLVGMLFFFSISNVLISSFIFSFVVFSLISNYYFMYQKRFLHNNVVERIDKKLGLKHSLGTTLGGTFTDFTDAGQQSLYAYLIKTTDKKIKKLGLKSVAPFRFPRFNRQNLVLPLLLICFFGTSISFATPVVTKFSHHLLIYARQKGYIGSDPEEFLQEEIRKEGRALTKLVEELEEKNIGRKNKKVLKRVKRLAKQLTTIDVDSAGRMLSHKGLTEGMEGKEVELDDLKGLIGSSLEEEMFRLENKTLQNVYQEFDKEETYEIQDLSKELQELAVKMMEDAVKKSRRDFVRNKSHSPLPSRSRKLPTNRKQSQGQQKRNVSQNGQADDTLSGQLNLEGTQINNDLGVVRRFRQVKRQLERQTAPKKIKVSKLKNLFKKIFTTKDNRKEMKPFKSKGKKRTSVKQASTAAGIRSKTSPSRKRGSRQRGSDYQSQLEDGRDSRKSGSAQTARSAGQSEKKGSRSALAEQSRKQRLKQLQAKQKQKVYTPKTTGSKDQTPAGAQPGQPTLMEDRKGLYTSQKRKNSKSLLARTQSLVDKTKFYNAQSFQTETPSPKDYRKTSSTTGQTSTVKPTPSQKTRSFSADKQPSSASAGMAAQTTGSQRQQKRSRSQPLLSQKRTKQSSQSSSPSARKAAQTTREKRSLPKPLLSQKRTDKSLSLSDNRAKPSFRSPEQRKTDRFPLSQSRKSEPAKPGKFQEKLNRTADFPAQDSLGIDNSSAKQLASLDTGKLDTKKRFDSDKTLKFNEPTFNSTGFKENPSGNQAKWKNGDSLSNLLSDDPKAQNRSKFKFSNTGTLGSLSNLKRKSDGLMGISPDMLKPGSSSVKSSQTDRTTGRAGQGAATSQNRSINRGSLSVNSNQKAASDDLAKSLQESLGSTINSGRNQGLVTAAGRNTDEKEEKSSRGTSGQEEDISQGNTNDGKLSLSSLSDREDGRENNRTAQSRDPEQEEPAAVEDEGGLLYLQQPKHVAMKDQSFQKFQGSEGEEDWKDEFADEPTSHGSPPERMNKYVNQNLTFLAGNEVKVQSPDDISAIPDALRPSISEAANPQNISQLPKELTQFVENVSTPGNINMISRKLNNFNKKLDYLKKRPRNKSTTSNNKGGGTGSTNAVPAAGAPAGADSMDIKIARPVNNRKFVPSLKQMVNQLKGNSQNLDKLLGDNADRDTMKKLTSQVLSSSNDLSKLLLNRADMNKLNPDYVDEKALNARNASLLKNAKLIQKFSNQFAQKMNKNLSPEQQAKLAEDMADKIDPKTRGRIARSRMVDVDPKTRAKFSKLMAKNMTADSRAKLSKEIIQQIDKETRSQFFKNNYKNIDTKARVKMAEEMSDKISPEDRAKLSKDMADKVDQKTREKFFKKTSKKMDAKTRSKLAKKMADKMKPEDRAKFAKDMADKVDPEIRKKYFKDNLKSMDPEARAKLTQFMSNDLTPKERAKFADLLGDKVDQKTREKFFKDNYKNIDPAVRAKLSEDMSRQLGNKLTPEDRVKFSKELGDKVDQKTREKFFKDNYKNVDPAVRAKLSKEMSQKISQKDRAKLSLEMSQKVDPKTREKYSKENYQKLDAETKAKFSKAMSKKMNSKTRLELAGQMADELDPKTRNDFYQDNFKNLDNNTKSKFSKVMSKSMDAKTLSKMAVKMSDKFDLETRRQQYQRNLKRMDKDTRAGFSRKFARNVDPKVRAELSKEMSQKVDSGVREKYTQENFKNMDAQTRAKYSQKMYDKFDDKTRAKFSQRGFQEMDVDSRAKLSQQMSSRAGTGTRSKVSRLMAQKVDPKLRAKFSKQMINKVDDQTRQQSSRQMSEYISEGDRVGFAKQMSQRIDNTLRNKFARKMSAKVSQDVRNKFSKQMAEITEDVGTIANRIMSSGGAGPPPNQRQAVLETLKGNSRRLENITRELKKIDSIGNRNLINDIAAYSQNVKQLADGINPAQAEKPPLPKNIETRLKRLLSLNEKLKENRSPQNLKGMASKLAWESNLLLTQWAGLRKGVPSGSLKDLKKSNQRIQELRQAMKKEENPFRIRALNEELIKASAELNKIALGNFGLSPRSLGKRLSQKEAEKIEVAGKQLRSLSRQLEKNQENPDKLKEVMSKMMLTADNLEKMNLSKLAGEAGAGLREQNMKFGSAFMQKTGSKVPLTPSKRPEMTAPITRIPEGVDPSRFMSQGMSMGKIPEGFDPFSMLSRMGGAGNPPGKQGGNTNRVTDSQIKQLKKGADQLKKLTQQLKQPQSLENLQEISRSALMLSQRFKNMASSASQQNVQLAKELSQMSLDLKQAADSLQKKAVARENEEVDLNKVTETVRKEREKKFRKLTQVNQKIRSSKMDRKTMLKLKNQFLAASLGLNQMNQLQQSLTNAGQAQPPGDTPLDRQQQMAKQLQDQLQKAKEPRRIKKLAQQLTESQRKIQQDLAQRSTRKNANQQVLELAKLAERAKNGTIKDMDTLALRLEEISKQIASQDPVQADKLEEMSRQALTRSDTTQKNAVAGDLKRVKDISEKLLKEKDPDRKKTLSKALQTVAGRLGNRFAAGASSQGQTVGTQLSELAKLSNSLMAEKNPEMRKLVLEQMTRLNKSMIDSLKKRLKKDPDDPRIKSLLKDAKKNRKLMNRVNPNEVDSNFKKQSLKLDTGISLLTQSFNDQFAANMTDAQIQELSLLNKELLNEKNAGKRRVIMDRMKKLNQGMINKLSQRLRKNSGDQQTKKLLEQAKNNKNMMQRIDPNQVSQDFKKQVLQLDGGIQTMSQNMPDAGRTSSGQLAELAKLNNELLSEKNAARRQGMMEKMKQINQGMIDKLSARLKQNPNDSQSRSLLEQAKANKKVMKKIDPNKITHGFRKQVLELNNGIQFLAKGLNPDSGLDVTPTQLAELSRLNRQILSEKNAARRKVMMSRMKSLNQSTLDTLTRRLTENPDDPQAQRLLRQAKANNRLISKIDPGKISNKFKQQVLQLNNGIQNLAQGFNPQTGFDATDSQIQELSRLNRDLLSEQTAPRRKAMMSRMKKLNQSVINTMSQRIKQNPNDQKPRRLLQQAKESQQLMSKIDPGKLDSKFRKQVLQLKTGINNLDQRLSAETAASLPIDRIAEMSELNDQLLNAKNSSRRSAIMDRLKNINGSMLANLQKRLKNNPDDRQTRDLLLQAKANKNLVKKIDPSKISPDFRKQVLNLDTGIQKMASNVQGGDMPLEQMRKLSQMNIDLETVKDSKQMNSVLKKMDGLNSSMIEKFSRRLKKNPQDKLARSMLEKARKNTKLLSSIKPSNLSEDFRNQMLQFDKNIQKTYKFTVSGGKLSKQISELSKLSSGMKNARNTGQISAMMKKMDNVNESIVKNMGDRLQENPNDETARKMLDQVRGNQDFLKKIDPGKVSADLRKRIMKINGGIQDFVKMGKIKPGEMLKNMSNDKIANMIESANQLDRLSDILSQPNGVSQLADNFDRIDSRMQELENKLAANQQVQSSDRQAITQARIKLQKLSKEKDPANKEEKLREVSSDLTRISSRLRMLSQRAGKMDSRQAMNDMRKSQMSGLWRKYLDMSQQITQDMDDGMLDQVANNMKRLSSQDLDLMQTKLKEGKLPVSNEEGGFFDRLKKSMDSMPLFSRFFKNRNVQNGLPKGMMPQDILKGGAVNQIDRMVKELDKFEPEATRDGTPDTSASNPTGDHPDLTNKQKPSSTTQKKSSFYNTKVAQMVSMAPKNDMVNNTTPMQENLAEKDVFQRIMSRLKKQRERIAHLGVGNRTMKTKKLPLSTDRSVRDETTYKQPEIANADFYMKGGGLDQGETPRHRFANAKRAQKKLPNVSFMEQADKKHFLKVPIRVKDKNKIKDLESEKIKKLKIKRVIAMGKQEKDSSVSHQDIPQEYEELIKRIYSHTSSREPQAVSN